MSVAVRELCTTSNTRRKLRQISARQSVALVARLVEQNTAATASMAPWSFPKPFQFSCEFYCNWLTQTQPQLALNYPRGATICTNGPNARKPRFEEPGKIQPVSRDQSSKDR